MASKVHIFKPFPGGAYCGHIRACGEYGVTIEEMISSGVPEADRCKRCMELVPALTKLSLMEL